jgi:hypothetical protein
MGTNPEVEQSLAECRGPQWNQYLLGQVLIRWCAEQNDCSCQWGCGPPALLCA